jgi:hypothetical protein
VSVCEIPLYFAVLPVFSCRQEAMKTPLIVTLVASTLIAFSGCGKKESGGTTPNIKPTRETSFAEVTRQLDPGGSVYGYLSTDQWLAGLSTNVSQLSGFLTSLPDVSSTDRRQIESVIRLLSHAIEKSGIESLNGIGVSGVQITPELHRTKFILHHGKGQGDGFIWNVMGRQPHALSGMNLLTTNTAIASFGDLDATLLWKAIEDEMRNSRIPELADAADKWPKLFEQQTKMSWEKLLASLGGEVGFVLTLDDSKKITLPLGEAMEIPEPGLLIALKVNDELLYERISSELKKSGQAEITDEKGLKMTAMRLPIPLPLDLQITVASGEGYFFLASSPKMVHAALEVRAGKQTGLSKTAAFSELMKYLPADGNQFCYVDRRFSGTIQSVQKEILAKQQPELAQAEFFRKFLLNRPPTFGLSISRHTATGWESVSVGNQDSATAVIAMPAVAGGAMAAAMVLPALANAKEKAQSISCMNNMKQISLAFRIWESDNADQFPFNVSKEKGGTKEFCEIGSDGFDVGSWRHFQVMSNELSTPKILVCPGDGSKQVASSFASFGPENVSYLVHSGKDVSDTNPEAILIYCPVHRNVGYVDGSVKKGSKNDAPPF